MPHPLRFAPALAGALILALILFGAGTPVDTLCTSVPQLWQADCLALAPGPSIMAVAAIALIALTLLLLMQWQRARRAVSYDSDAGKWVVLGWILAIGGTLSLLAGLLLIGANGWPFSRQSRHISVMTGPLPLVISTVQRRYLARYPGGDGAPSLYASFGDVTLHNRSRTRSLTLDLDLVITPRDRAAAGPRAAIPTRADLAAMPRRGARPQAMFGNPVALAPRQRLRRELVFVFHDAHTDLSDRDYSFVLAVNDRDSRQTVALALPAEYRG